MILKQDCGVDPLSQAEEKAQSERNGIRVQFSGTLDLCSHVETLLRDDVCWDGLGGHASPLRVSTMESDAGCWPAFLPFRVLKIPPFLPFLQITPFFLLLLFL